MIKGIKIKSEKLQQKELQQRISNYKPGYGKDGYIEIGKKKFIYKKIPYMLRISRYYNHTDKFVPMGDRITDKHCLVEHAKKMKPVANILEEIDVTSSFLWYDTLHSWNDNQTIDEQINECHKVAKQDINVLFSKRTMNKIRKKINEMEQLKQILKQSGETT